MAYATNECLMWWLIGLSTVSVVLGSLCQKDASWSCRRSKEISNEFYNEKVFITSLPRSGSSFVGNIFAHDPNFVYLFEAFRIFSEGFHKDKCSTFPKTGGNMTVDTFNCNLNSLKFYADNVTSLWGNLYSWSRIEALSHDTNSCLYNIDPINFKRKSVAVKEVESWSPKFNWLYDNVGSDLRILWLVRDVRGWVSSFTQNMTQKSFYYGWNLHNHNFWERYENCDITGNGQILNPDLITTIRELLNNKTALPHLRMAAWWTMEMAVTKYYVDRFKGKMLLVKYEHISQNPFSVLQQIYKFLGRPAIHPDVVNWALSATASGNVKDRYETNRDSKIMADIWRTRLTAKEIDDIQELAGILFPYFEYDFVKI